MCAGYGVGVDGGGAGYGLLPMQGQQMQMRYMVDQLRKELQQRSFLTHAQASQLHLHPALEVEVTPGLVHQT